MQPIKLYSHSSGPNPYKVMIIMEELGLDYKVEMVDFAVIKQVRTLSCGFTQVLHALQKPFTDVNPNGRVPAIHDPNQEITLWESGAIVDYLVQEYDKDHKISHQDKKSKYLDNQWLHFQVSGQGPYFGQAVWFRNFHGEKIPSAMERYVNEVKRVTKVLNDHLEAAGTPYLTGDKCTYADLSFVPWIVLLDVMIMPKEDADEMIAGLPAYKKWIESIMARESVKTTLKKREEAMAAGK